MSRRTLFSQLGQIAQQLVPLGTSCTELYASEDFRPAKKLDEVMWSVGENVSQQSSTRSPDGVVPEHAGSRAEAGTDMAVTECFVGL